MNIVGILIAGALRLVTSAEGVFTLPFARSYPIPVGETWFTGEAQIVGFYFDSNNKHAIAEYTYRFLHHLSDPTDSETYRTGDMLQDQEILFDRATYNALVSTYIIEMGQPRLSDPVHRVGNIIEYEVTVPFIMVSV